MTKKLANRLTNNIGLKLFSVVLAVILWMVVVNIDNPQTTITFTSSAAMINENIITDNGKVYEILDNSNSIKFSVTGPRTIVEGMSASDFTVVADMNKIDLDLGLVPVEVSADRYASKVSVTLKSTNVHVSIEDLKIRQFAVNASANGAPMEGYALGEVSCAPATVTISGPESVIKRIDKVAAIINLEGMYSDRTQTVVPVLYDENGNKITSNNVTIEPTTVQVNAKILETKSVNVVYEYNGTLEKGRVIESIKCLPENLLVKGTKENLAELTQIKIPSDELNLANAEGTLEKKVSITPYLPEGVELVDPEQSTVVIKIELGSHESKEFEIDASKIKILNLDDELEYEFQQDTVKVVVEGSRDSLKNIKNSDIELSLSFSGVNEGNFTLTPNVKDISGVSKITVSRISGKLTKKTDDVNDGE